MSDRYETPSWDDESHDSTTRTPVAGDAVPADAVGVEAGDQDLEASSENVLDGWPSVDPEAVPDDEPAAEGAPAAEAAEVATPDRDDPDVAPVPLADHVSDSVEHAPGELTVPPGYSVLEGIP